LLNYKPSIMHKNPSNTEHPNLLQLKAHSAEFRKDLIQLNDILYVGVGYDASNVAMVIGEDGVIIIDSLRSLDAAEELAADFRKITDKPVKALIYTHGHFDHIGGATAFVNEDTTIIGRSNFREEMDATSPAYKAITKRGLRMFATNMPDEVVINRGVSAANIPKGRIRGGYLPPTQTFDERLSITIAGIDIELYGTKGETDDHLFAWLPNEKILFSGDNYYKSFPNLYTIRGTKYRDVRDWGEANKKMASFPADYLVSGHSRPLTGKAYIHQQLSNYSEGILSIYQQTMEGINQGLTMDELCEKVSLPDHLKEADNLQEFYGHVAWSVLNIFVGYLGWFDGNPTSLFPLPPLEKATLMLELAGGKKQLLAKAQQALTTQKYQWCLELTDYLLRIDPQDTLAKSLKVEALRNLAATLKNANARNYYLVSAEEL